MSSTSRTCYTATLRGVWMRISFVLVASTMLTTLGVAQCNAPVNLNNFYNQEGIVTDGTTFSQGIAGTAYSENLLSSVFTGFKPVFAASNFNLGPANQLNLVSAQGNTIPLPSGNYRCLQMLGTGVFGSQLAQTFTVNYTSGPPSTFIQSLSDWFAPQNFPGESIAATTAYRDLSNGTTQNLGAPFNLYLYSFGLNNNLTVNSITLPNNQAVKVLALTLVP